jgi:hypothetical protein
VHTFALVLNYLAVVVFSAFCLLSLGRQVRRGVGRLRRRGGALKLAASSTPSPTDTSTSAATPHSVAFSSSTTVRGLASVDTETLLRLAEQSRRGGLGFSTTSFGKTEHGDTGRPGRPLGDAA